MAHYKGYYFEEGQSFRLVAVAILDTSVMSHDLRMSIEARLVSLAQRTYEVRSEIRENPDFPEYITDRPESLDEEVDRRR